MKSATARGDLQLLTSYRGHAGGKLLEVGCGRGEGLLEAARAGYEGLAVVARQAADRSATTHVVPALREAA